MKFHVIHHLSAELEYLIRGIPALEHGAQRANQQLEQLKELMMAISPQVQAVLDAIAQNTSLVASVDAALKAEGDQITALQAQVADLQAKLAAGTALSAEDVAALASAVQQLGDTNTKLQADVPANTPAAPAA